MPFVILDFRVAPVTPQRAERDSRSAKPMNHGGFADSCAARLLSRQSASVPLVPLPEALAWVEPYG